MKNSVIISLVEFTCLETKQKLDNEEGEGQKTEHEMTTNLYFQSWVKKKSMSERESLK